MNLKTVSEQVFDILKQRILTHDLPPGTRLQEQDLAAELGVSRTPLREAIARLSQAGLVTLQARRSAYVTNLSMREVIEVLEVREALECQSVRLAAEKATAADVEEIMALLDKREAQLLEDGSQGMPEFDLHESLVHLSGNRRLLEFMNTIRNQLNMLRLGSSMTSGRSREVIEEHRNIVRAIAAGDADLAEKQMRAHLAHARKNIVTNVVRENETSLEDGHDGHGDR